MMLRARLSVVIMCTLTLLAGCATYQTYGDRSIPDAGRAVVEGYWRYLLVYFEELQLVSVDGKLVGGEWAYASSISVPAGKHRLRFVILRNNRDIAICAFDSMFEAGHHYKLQQLHHQQGLLAHPTSASFAASIAMDTSTPTGHVQGMTAPAECGSCTLSNGCGLSNE